MGEKYTTLLQKVKQMNAEDLDSLKEQVQSANEQWKEIHELAGVLYTQDLKWSDVCEQIGNRKEAIHFFTRFNKEKYV